MATGYPRFGAEIVEVDPHRRWLASCHGFDKSFWKLAGEGLDHDIAEG